MILSPDLLRSSLLIFTAGGGVIFVVFCGGLAPRSLAVGIGTSRSRSLGEFRMGYAGPKPKFGRLGQKNRKSQPAKYWIFTSFMIFLIH